MNRLVNLGFLSLALVACVSAQSTYYPSPPAIVNPAPSSVQPKCDTGTAGTLSVAGRGFAEATADVAKISLSIAILNQTAEGARLVAAGFADKVVESVRQINGVSPDNVTTTSVSVRPETKYNSTAGTSTTVGYVYTNYLSISLDNLTGDLLSEVLDTAVSNGGNNLTISSVAFSLSPQVSYNRTIDARRQAAQDVKTTAQQYADGLGITLGALLSVTDQSATSTPVQDTDTQSSDVVGYAPTAADRQGSSKQTPVSIGKERVTAAISATFTICSKTS